MLSRILNTHQSNTQIDAPKNNEKRIRQFVRNGFKDGFLNLKGYVDGIESICPETLSTYFWKEVNGIQEKINKISFKEFSNFFKGSVGLKNTKALIRLLTRNRISHFSFKRNDISLDAFKFLAECLNDIQALEIRLIELKLIHPDCAQNEFYRIDTQELQWAIEGLKGKSLNRLDLSYNSLTDEDLIEMCNGLDLNRIESLKLEGNEFKDKGLRALTDSLVNSCNLKSLTLADCETLSQNAVAYFFKNLKNTQLTFLDLSFCQLDDGAAIELFKGLNGSLISSLHLKGNQFKFEFSKLSTEGDKAISLDNTSLTHLDISQNPIDKEQGLIEVGKLVQNSKIKVLDLEEAILPNRSDPFRDFWNYIRFTKDTPPKSSPIFQFSNHLKNSKVNTISFSGPGLIAQELLELSQNLLGSSITCIRVNGHTFSSNRLPRLIDHLSQASVFSFEGLNIIGGFSRQNKQALTSVLSHNFRRIFLPSFSIFLISQNATGSQPEKHKLEYFTNPTEPHPLKFAMGILRNLPIEMVVLIIAKELESYVPFDKAHRVAHQFYTLFANRAAIQEDSKHQYSETNKGTKWK